MNPTEVAEVKRRMREELVRAVPPDRIDDRLKWLHERTGEAYKNVQRYLNGPNAPPIDFLVAFCDATNRRLDYIMAGREPKDLTPPAEAERRLNEIRRVVLEEIGPASPAPVERFRPLPPDEERKREAR